MSAAIDRVSSGGSRGDGGAGDACGGPQRRKNKHRNLRNLRSIAWTAALGLLSLVPTSSAGIFAYNFMELEVRIRAKAGKGDLRSCYRFPLHKLYQRYRYAHNM